MSSLFIQRWFFQSSPKQVHFLIIDNWNSKTHPWCGNPLWSETRSDYSDNNPNGRRKYGGLTRNNWKHQLDPSTRTWHQFLVRFHEERQWIFEHVRKQHILSRNTKFCWWVDIFWSKLILKTVAFIAGKKNPATQIFFIHFSIEIKL